MKIRPLLIGPPQTEDIQRVIAYAFRNPITMEEMKQAGSPGATVRNRGRVELGRGDDRTPTIGDDPLRWCVVPVGYRCCFSIEEQPAPLGWTRHLSVSVIPTEKGAYPSIPSVRMLANDFGFRGAVGAEKSMLVYEEPEFQAINVIQPLTQEERARIDL